MIVWGPLVVGVKLTVQLVETAPVVGLVLALPSVQLAAENVRALVGTLAVPVARVPAPAVASVTVDVQLVGRPPATYTGVHLTLLVVPSFTARRSSDLELPSCVMSPP